MLRFLGSLGSSSALDVRVHLVDDGSTDGTASAVAELHPAVNVLHGDGLLWWSGAINLGLTAALDAGTEYVAIFNNDCVLPAGALEHLVRRCQASPRTIISAAIADLATGQPVSFGGRFGPTGLEYWESIPPNVRDGLASVDWLPGHALVLPAAALTEIGVMDAKAFPHYWSDSDFTLRARRAGYRLVVDTAVMVANDRGQTGLRLRYPVRPKNVFEVLTSRRSWLRVDDNARFWWRHRDVVQGRMTLRRYQPIPVGLLAEALDRLHLRARVRRLRRTG